MPSTPTRSALIRFAALVGCMALLAGCSKDEPSAAPSPEPTHGSAAPSPEPTHESAAPRGDLDRFCELSQELDQAGTKFFNKLLHDKSATDKDFAQGETEFFKAHKPQITALLAAAPDEIDDAATTMVADLKERAGLGPKVNPKEAGDAATAVQAFTEANC